MSPLEHVTEAAAKAEGLLQSILGSAKSEDVYGPVTTVGDRTIIPVAAIERAGGFGFGGGGGSDEQDNEGGGVGVGGGGASTARPVAVIEVDESGVRVRPILDLTKVALVALAAVLAIRRMRRGH
jgi:uncharacterized spore protein YtfJ